MTFLSLAPILGKTRSLLQRAPSPEPSTATPRQQPARRTMVALEPRLLFDGAMLASADALLSDATTIVAREPSSQDDIRAATASESTNESDDVLKANESMASPATAPPDIVFVDSRIADTDAFIAQMDSQVIVIEADRGGLTQIADALNGRTNLAAIHIVSHGEAGKLFLGSSVLSEATIAGPYAQLLAQIGTSLATSGDLLIYGCEFAAGDTGRSAVDALASATGADVAASTDNTGAATLAGDWDLEHHNGDIEATAVAAFDWNHVLAPISISVSGPPVVTAAAGTTTEAASSVSSISQDGAKVSPATSSIVGTTARWNNAGQLGAQALDLVATVITAGTDDFIQFGSPSSITSTRDDPTLLIGDSNPGGAGPDSDVVVTLSWEIFLAGTSTPAQGDFSFLITDIDGVSGPNTRESVAASVNDPVSFTLADPTYLIGGVQGTLLQVDGTANSSNNTEERAWVKFNWVNASEFELTYTLVANNGVTSLAGFSHDGDGDLSFTASTTVAIPKLDLDGSEPGYDYQTTYTEDGSAVVIVDSDVEISNTGGSVTGAVLVLTNRDVGDSLTIGSLPGGISGVIDASDPARITVTLSGTGNDADYQTALQAVRYSNSSQDPSTTARNIEVHIANSLTDGNLAITTMSIVAQNDGPSQTVPGAQNLLEDGVLTFSSANSNAMSIADIDAGSQTLTTTLSVSSGVLALGSTAGVTVGGNNSASVVVTGTVSAINAALSGTQFTPANNASGSVAMTVATNDNGNTGLGGALNTSDTIALTVAAVNDAPTAINDAITTAEDTAVTLDVRSNDADVEGDAISVTLVDGNAISLGNPVSVSNGSVVLNADGRLTFTPDSNYNGVTTFTYQVSDGNAGTDNATVAVTVSAVNDGPSATNDSLSTSEDTPVSSNVTSNDSDVDGDSLSVTQVDGNVISVGNPVAVSNGSVALEVDGRLTFTPASNFVGATSYDYLVDDGNGASSTATVNVTVIPVNDAPSATNDSVSTNEDSAVTLDARTNDGDIDGDSLTVNQVDGSAISIGNPVAVSNGSVALGADGRLSFTPANHYNGTTSFTYQVNDGNGGSATATVNVTVVPTNDTPVAIDDAFTGAEDTPITIDPRFNDSDVDGDGLIVSQIDGQAISIGNPIGVTNGSVSLLADGRLQFTPDANFAGNTTFAYTVSDGNGASANANILMGISPVNDAPQAVADAVLTEQDVAIIFDPRANDNDVDGDALVIDQINGLALTMGIPLNVANGQVALQADGQLQFTPDNGYQGASSFTYRVTDGNGTQASETVTVTVVPPNSAPTANDDSVSVSEDGSVDIDPRGNDNDPENNPLTVVQVNGQALSVGVPVNVSNGQVTLLANGSLRFAPASDFFGSSSFTYTIADSLNAQATATINTTVIGANDAVAATDDTVSSNEDIAVDIDAVSNDIDVDGDALFVSHVEGTPINVSSPVNVSNGVVSLLANGQLRFTPNANVNGANSFSYTVADGNGSSDDATVNLNLTPVNDAPTAVDDSTSTDEEVAVTIDVRSNDSDIDADALSVTRIDGSAVGVGVPVVVSDGTVTLQADGRLLFTPANNFFGSTQFAYRVSDPSGQTADAQVNLTINNINDTPHAADDSYSIAEDTATVIDIIDNDDDADNEALTVRFIDGQAISPGTSVSVSDGTVSMTTGGELRFTPASNFSGNTTFTYGVDDASGAAASATVSLVVSPVNDAPLAQDDSVSTPEDTAITLTPIANDSDIEGAPLTIVRVNGQTVSMATPIRVANGDLELLASGAMRFTPSQHFNGQTHFDYHVQDSAGAQASATMTIDVTPVNDAPSADNDRIETNIGSQVIIDPRNNDSDADADALRISEVQGQALTVGEPVSIDAGLITLRADGRLQFEPSATEQGDISFQYTVIDSSGASASATVTVLMTSVSNVETGEIARIEQYQPAPSRVIVERSGDYGPVYVSKAVRESQRGQERLKGLERLRLRAGDMPNEYATILALAPQRGNGQTSAAQSNHAEQSPLSLGHFGRPFFDISRQQRLHDVNSYKDVCWNGDVPLSVRILQDTVRDAQEDEKNDPDTPRQSTPDKQEKPISQTGKPDKNAATSTDPMAPPRQTTWRGFSEQIADARRPSLSAHSR